MATQTVTELQTLSKPAPTTTSHPAAAPHADTESASPLLPKARALFVIAQVSGLLFFSSFCNGIVVVALPAMQSTLSLPEGLLVWPTSSYYLTAGSCLLLAGSVADVAGAKRVGVVGAFLSAVFALACGVAATGSQIIAFRALQGVANSMIVPSSVAIISNCIEEGRPRNMSIACMGFSQPLGFSFGLVLAGAFTDTVGWRPAFYLAAAASMGLFFLGIWVLPKDKELRAMEAETGRGVWMRIVKEVDWVGVLLASTGLAMLSYVLA